MKNKNFRIMLVLALVGVFFSLMVYLFHTDTSQIAIIVNGQPVSEPVVFIGAIPAIFVVLTGTALLMLLTFFGVGVLFLLAGMFFLFGIFLLIPFSWPVLILIFLIILILSFEDNGGAP